MTSFWPFAVKLSTRIASDDDEPPLGGTDDDEEATRLEGALEEEPPRMSSGSLLLWVRVEGLGFGGWGAAGLCDLNPKS